MIQSTAKPWASVGVGLHHALKGTFQALAHAVAAANNAFHDAELFDVAVEQFVHAALQLGKLGFVLRDLAGRGLALGVDGVPSQASSLPAVNDLLVGARTGLDY